ncbi:MAG: glycosyltransferase family 2 protein [Candidatus Helarchaeota archaeon]
MISVIIPTYNRAKLLPRAIRSVLNQTYENFEIIIIDDASKDNTQEVVNSFSDRRIKYICLYERVGVAAARNIGIKTSEGKFLTFLDSDDEWHPMKLKAQIDAINRFDKEIGIIYTSTLRKYDDKQYAIPSNKVKKKEGYLFRNMILGRYLVPTPSALVKKICFEKCGYFDENLRVLEEWDLWIRMSKFFKLGYINKPMTFSYYTPSSLSTHRELFALGIWKIIKKHFKDFIIRPDALFLAIYRMIRLYFGYLLYILGWRRN